MTFIPGVMIITDITRAIPAVVTTQNVHNLVTGQVVRLNVPPAYGMLQLNDKRLSVTVLSTTKFSLQYRQAPEFFNVDSRNFEPFVNAGIGTPANATCSGEAPTPITSPYPYLNNGIAYSLPDNATNNNSTVEIPF
jgi:hypothetical protein